MMRGVLCSSVRTSGVIHSSIRIRGVLCKSSGGYGAYFVEVAGCILNGYGAYFVAAIEVVAVDDSRGLAVNPVSIRPE